MSNHHAVKSQAEMAELFSQDLTTGVGRSVKHDSADKHVAGEAVYIDDRLDFPNQLHVYARTADRAHARILRIDTTPCYAFEGVRIAFGGMAAIPKRARACEAALRGKPWNQASIERACQALAEDFSPLSDFRASKEYRLLTAQNLLRKYFIEQQTPYIETRVTAYV